jgi:hypothetical protein
LLLHLFRKQGSFKNVFVFRYKEVYRWPEQVLKHLARYTHRLTVSNGRLLTLDNGQVRFRWRDSRHKNRIGVMTLHAVEFIRRFLLHVLPAEWWFGVHDPLLVAEEVKQRCEMDASPVDASPHPSRYTAHDSESVWFATP